jgi:hypothetical protein
MANMEGSRAAGDPGIWLDAAVEGGSGPEQQHASTNSKGLRQ